MPREYLRDYLSVDDLGSAELLHLLDVADALKADRTLHRNALAGLSIALLFEKASTRTRVSFEVGIGQLGGRPLTLSGSDLQLGRGETIEDTGRVLSRYVDAIVLRTFEQERLEALAEAATVPVINSLSDFEHPCQALADLMTIREHLGALNGKILTYVGDGNNVAHSLLLAGAKMGMTVRIAAPTGFEPIPQVVQRASEIAEETGEMARKRQRPGSRLLQLHHVHTGRQGRLHGRLIPARGRVQHGLADAGLQQFPRHLGQEGLRLSSREAVDMEDSWGRG